MAEAARQIDDWEPVGPAPTAPAQRAQAVQQGAAPGPNDFEPVTPPPSDFEPVAPSTPDIAGQSSIGRVWSAFRSGVAAPSEFVGSLEDAFARGFAGQWGKSPTGKEDLPPLGDPERTIPRLQGLGLARTGKETGFDAVAKAADELLFFRGAQIADAAMRTPFAVMAGIGGVYGGLQEAGLAMGLHRDIVSLPDAFMGAPHMLPGTGGAMRQAVTVLGDIPLRVRAVLSEPTVRDAIDNGPVNRANHVPYEAGASATSNVTHIDSSIPQIARLPSGKFFDPGIAAKVHEQPEKFVMETLIAHGMPDDAAYRVAHWEYAEKAEDAWYRAQGIDPKEAEAWWKERAGEIQHEPSANTPPDLYDKPYPHDSISAAQTEGSTATPRPTEEEIERANRIMGMPSEAAAARKALGIPEPTTPEGSNYRVRINTDPPQYVDADTPSKLTVPDDHLIDITHLNGERIGNPLDLAKELGVIGPEKPPPSPGETASEAAQRAVPAAQPPDAKVTQTPAGEPLTAWEARFKDWVRRIKEPDDVRQFIEDAAAANNNFPEARAGAIDPAHLEVVADAAGVAPSSLNRGELSAKFNSADKVRMIKQALDQTLQDFKAAADNYAADASPANLSKMLEAELRRDYVVEYTVGMRADWAHFGHALRELLEPRAVGEEAPPKEKPPKTSVTKEAFDVVDAAKDVAKNIAKPGANRIGLIDLVNAAQELVGAEAKAKRPKGEPLHPEIAELVKTAQAVQRLIPTETAEAPRVPTVRPLRKLLPGKEPEPTSAHAKFNQLILEAERNVTEAAQENEATARAEMPKELRDLVDAAKRVSDFFGGAGLERRVQEILAEKERSAEQQATLAKTIKPLTMEQTAQLLAKMRSVKPTLWDQYLSVFTNWVLSGFVTHTKYILANAAFAGYEAAITLPAGVSGTIRRAISGSQEGVMLGEAPMRLWGLVSGIPAAVKGMVYAARNNTMAPVPGRITNLVSPITEQRPDVLGPIGKVLTLNQAPVRGVAAIHSFFNILGNTSELEARAYRQAVLEGLKPTSQAFWIRQWELARDTDQLEKLMPGTAQAAIDNGERLTFINEPGKVGKKIAQFANTRFQFPGTNDPRFEWQPFRMIMPFTRLPGQIMRRAQGMAPMFSWMDSQVRDNITGRNGAVAQDMEIGRLAFGSAVGVMIINWALNDNITGYGPTDPNERALWDKTHKPYSIRISSGGDWHSYEKFGPLGTLLGLHANLAEIGPQLKEGEYGEAAGRVAKATSRLIEDEVGMQGLANIIEAMGDPNKAKRWVAGQVSSSTIPFSSFLRQTASVTDPYMREAKDFLDMLKQNVPGVRQDLLPRRGLLGEPLPNPGYMTLIKSAPSDADPIYREMERLQMKPGPTQDYIGGVKLTPQLADEYRARAGIAMHGYLEALLEDPNWRALPDYIRRQDFDATIRGARQETEGLMQQLHPELIFAGDRQRLDYIYGVSPTRRPKGIAPELTAPPLDHGAHSEWRDGR